MGKAQSRRRRRTETVKQGETKQNTQSRVTARLQRLREHHEKCFTKYMEYENHQTQSSGLSHQEKESTSPQDMTSELPTASSSSPFMISPIKEEEAASKPSPEALAPHNSLDTSCSTEMFPPESTASTVIVDPTLVTLEITDCVFLTEDFFESTSRTPAYSDTSVSCIGSSGDEYHPSKDSTKKSRSDKSHDLKSKLSPLKLKKQKKSKRTYSRKTVSSKLSAKDDRRAGILFILPASSTPRRQRRVQLDYDDAEEAGPSAPRRETLTSITDHEEGPQICDRAQQDEHSAKETSKKRMWTPDEVRAVEKTLKVFIDSGKVPGKADCMDCIKASLQVLKTRTWTAVKYYVKNCITAIQRERAKRH